MHSSVHNRHTNLQIPYLLADAHKGVSSIFRGPLNHICPAGNVQLQGVGFSSYRRFDVCNVEQKGKVGCEFFFFFS